MIQTIRANHRWRVPLLEGLLPFDRARLWPDIMAGITLAALGIPSVMGYTKIIGTPLVTGLYTLLLPVMVFALFGSSRHLVVSADSATAAIVAGALVSLSLLASTPRYVAMTSLVALLAGGMLLLARILRLGFLADFLSRSVLVGFLSGVGVQVALGELNGILGIEKGGHGLIQQLMFIFQHLSETRLTTLYMALAVLGILVGFGLFAPRFPGALLVVIGMTAGSAWFHWGEHGIGTVGEVPGGLPRFGLPDVAWDDVPAALPIAFSCFIVILAQSAATSRVYAQRYRDSYSQNVDLVGLALANVAAGFSSTFVVNGSPTKTAMVDTGGGRSQVSHLTTAATVLMVLLFLTKPLSYLPEVVLAVIVFLVGVKLIDHHGLADLYQKAPREFALAAATAVTVVFVGVEPGIILAVVLSLLQHVRRSYQPYMAVIVRDEVDHWQMETPVPGKMIAPGLVMFWFGSDLFYANASLFVTKARQLVDESPSPVRWLVIDARAITGIDYSAGCALAELQQDLARNGVVLAIDGIKPIAGEKAGQRLKQLGLIKLIGPDRIFSSRKRCLAAYHAWAADHPEPA